MWLVFVAFSCIRHCRRYVSFLLYNDACLLIKTTVAREPIIEIIGLTKQSFNSNFHPVYHEGVASCFCHSFHQQVLVVYLAATKDRQQSELDSDVTTFTDFHRSL